MSFQGKLQCRETWNKAAASCIVQVGDGDGLEWERVMEVARFQTYFEDRTEKFADGLTVV